jgi:hypothetical protein
LISINIFDQDVKDSLLPSLIPKTKKYKLKMKVLGLRGMKSSFFKEIRRPLVKMNFCNATNQKFYVEDNIIIKAKNGGTNPNFSTIIKLYLKS